MAAERLDASSQFFQATGLIGDTNPVSPLLARLACEFRPSDVVRLIRNGHLPEHYFYDDAGAYGYVKFVEVWANIVNEYMLSDPHAAELGRELNENPHHGYNHLRRIEKWDKEIFKIDRSFRSDDGYLFFQFSKYIGIRFHDLVEISTGQKTAHDRMASMYAFAFLEKHFDDVFGVLSSREYEHPISDLQAQKLIWGAAFIIMHHSKPEKIPSVHTMMTNGLFDVRGLAHEMAAYTSSQGKGLSEYFPPFASVMGTIGSMANGEYRQPSFERYELDGLVRQARILAACDKLDSTFPSDLSAARTVLTRPDRMAYLRLPGGQTLEEEFNARVANGGRQESLCDLNRILYEPTRTEAFDGLSSYVSYAYGYGLVKKMEFFSEALPDFLEGRFGQYLSGYDQYFNETVMECMRKAGIGDADGRFLAAEPNRTKLMEKLETELLRHGIDPHPGLQVLHAIAYEQKTVHDALLHKYTLLQENNISAVDVDRVKELLRIAREVQTASLRKTPGPANFRLPYTSYYYVPVQKLPK